MALSTAERIGSQIVSRHHARIGSRMSCALELIASIALPNKSRAALMAVSMAVFIGSKMVSRTNVRTALSTLVVVVEIASQAAPTTVSTNCNLVSTASWMACQVVEMNVQIRSSLGFRTCLLYTSP